MFTNIVRHALVDENLKVSDLARLINTKYQNIDQKLKRDNFSEKEMRDIAAALGYSLELKFVKK